MLIHRLTIYLSVLLATTLASVAWAESPLTALRPEQTQLTSGFLATRHARNITSLFERIDTAPLVDVFSSLHEPWYAEPEFAGQYLDAAAVIASYASRPDYLERARPIVQSMIQHQRADGYLGTYRPGSEFANFGIWNHWFVLNGLLSYYEATKDKAVLPAITRAGDFVVAAFLHDQQDLFSSEVNAGLQHTTGLYMAVRLYQMTGKEDYLALARHIVDKWEHREGERYALVSNPDCLKLGWIKAAEMLICYKGLVALASATHDEAPLRAAERYWQSVRDTQIGPTGNGSLAEHWRPDGRRLIAEPDADRPNENCVGVSWMELSAMLLEQTGDAKYADAFEQTLYNHLLGSQHPEGVDFAYYQPLEGKKVLRTNPDLYQCCRYRGLCMLGHLSRYIVMQSPAGLAVNLYTASESTLEVDGQSVRIVQETDYPRSGAVAITVQPADHHTEFTLSLRKPAWCSNVELRINGEPAPATPDAKGYIPLRRQWAKAGDRVEMNLTLPTRVEHQLVAGQDRVAIFHGPVLLAADTRGGTPIAKLTLPSAASYALEPVPDAPTSPPTLVHFTTAGLSLIDYASAGTVDPAHDDFRIWIPTTP